LVDELVGARLFFKAENFQRMGAFKFRGAYHALSRFDAQQRKRGVVAYSSGNHAQAVALAARILTMPATIVMPLDAPAAKVAATRSYGAEVVTYDRYTEDREQIGRDLAERNGLTLIPPYDHPTSSPGKAPLPGSSSRTPGPSTRCSSLSVAADCSPVLPCPRGRSPQRVGSTAWSQPPATTASSRSAKAPSCTSPRP
jgi:hypothetical protein